MRIIYGSGRRSIIKLIADPWRMVKQFESKYKLLHPEYKSPTKKEIAETKRLQEYVIQGRTWENAARDVVGVKAISIEGMVGASPEDILYELASTPTDRINVVWDVDENLAVLLKQIDRELCLKL